MAGAGKIWRHVHTRAYAVVGRFCKTVVKLSSLNSLISA